jgi:hypothetical protein
MTIDAYVLELGRRLPSMGSRRFLAEVEAHLWEATHAHVGEGVVRADAEERAVEAFGPVDVVAEGMWRETAPKAVRRAAAVALLALGSLVLPLYVVPENLLPPAPWDERPGYLGLLLVVALVCWGFAGAHVVFALAAPGKHGACALLLAAVFAALSGLAGLAAGVAWHLDAPATPWSVTAIAAPLTFGALGVLGATALWARSRAFASR